MELDAGRREAQVALAGYGLMIVTCVLCGYRMTIPYAYYQLLGADHLGERLFESLLYLHAQPPLLNLTLGLALKASRWLTVSPETILLAGHIGLGAIGVWAFVRLSQRLVASPLVRWICIGFFVLHPAFYLALFQYFYTFHELVLLCLIPLSAMWCVETRRVGAYALLCGEILLLVHTHSLFHWAFGAAVLGGVAWAALRSGPERAAEIPVRATLLCFGVATTLLLVWPAKNWILLDEFSYSTWGGYSLALELPIPREKVPVREWSVPGEFQHIPVLAEPRKIDGSRNWNHYSMIGYSHRLGDVALTTLADDPLALLRKARLNYWNYTRFSGRNPYTGKFGTAEKYGGEELPDLAVAWMRAYEVIFYLDPRAASSLAHRAHRSPPRQSWAVSGFFFAFPLLVVGTGFALYRRWPETSPAKRIGIVLLLSTLLWVLAATLLVDGSEANRIRFPTEPYLPLLCGWLIASRRRNGRRLAAD
jgi:hypothetical protein